MVMKSNPAACRFTWDVIRRHKEGRAIVLTTHSMEEADILADRIAVMADGQLAAAGTSLDLKSRFGVGYTLTVSMVRGIWDPGCCFRKFEATQCH